MQFDLSGKKVLVTGGTGFIGGRLVERLVLECNADVRVLVHNFAHVPRIARFPVEMVHGDVTKFDDVERAVRGCEIVVHCAYGNQGSKKMRRLVNVEGTRNVMEAALHAGVRRVVHLSTAMVYGIMTDGDIDETVPKRYSGDVYADSKLDAEKIAFRYVEQGLPVVVIQPTAVYGPFASVWTVRVLQRLKIGQMILVNGGEGLHNVVYIDDVVSAILLAAVKKEAVGEAFLISGEQPITWRDFYGRYERMLGISATVSMSAAEAEAYYRKRQKHRGLLKEVIHILYEEPSVRERILQTREIAALKGIASFLLPEQVKRSLKGRIMSNSRSVQITLKEERPIHPLSPSQIRFYALKKRVHIDKARRILGYRPAFDFESGMRLTEQWARWANLLDIGKGL
ncbi:NAD-dependent epimerase/dehydratase family protein [Candidatus Bathyarchaeota archaeon]|nr:MAG: NAD-dependent epimerase/dehydratase family protein [Candidatus Bathyarchaeota archaeon]